MYTRKSAANEGNSNDCQINISTYRTFLITISIQIAAVATINFSLIGVRLLIEGGSYLKVVFIYFGAISPGTVHKNGNAKDLFMRTALKLSRYGLKKQKNSHAAIETSKGCLLPCFCLKLMIVHCLQSWPHPLNWVHACMRLLYLRTAIIPFTELQVQPLFKGSYYLGCSYYSNKYGTF